MAPEDMRDRRDYSDKLYLFNRELGQLTARVDGVDRALHARVDSIERRLEEKLEDQSKDLETLRLDAKESNKKLDEVLDLVKAGKTSWKTIAAAAAAMSSMVVGIVWLTKEVLTFFGAG